MSHKTYNQILDEHLHILVAQGNHEAFNQLTWRYHKHAVNLVNDLLSKYSFTGISNKELLVACEDYFPIVLSKFTPGMSSFFTFWKETSSQVLMDYLIENSYDGEAFIFRGIVSLDQKRDEKHPYSELLGERGDDKLLKKKVFEIKHALNKYAAFFTHREKALLNLILEGYSLKELEHSGLLVRSQLILTYKSAIEKLKKYVKDIDK